MDRAVKEELVLRLHSKLETDQTVGDTGKAFLPDPVPCDSVERVGRNLLAEVADGSSQARFDVPTIDTGQRVVGANRMTPEDEDNNATDSMERSGELIKCYTCLLEFSNREAKLAHECVGARLTPNNFLEDMEDSVDSTLNDVENFEGKIMINPDGSACIIEADGIDRCSRSESPVAASVSPGSAQLFPPSSHSPSSSSAVPISLVGISSEHPNGKTNGFECPKCNIVLGSKRSLGRHKTMTHSKNSCKTLKCPKCNWHYKYQETLEIHMKEKHPGNETTCIYCKTNQPHPRLARGETYTCGYKPYRCNVCNYSTTTKGNLNIHLKSDKHLKNTQELQNGGVAPETNAQQPQGGHLATGSPSNQKPKPKPTWRCDACNYETNVAGNMRIHTTSEKHKHNMNKSTSRAARKAAAANGQNETRQGKTRGCDPTGVHSPVGHTNKTKKERKKETSVPLEPPTQLDQLGLPSEPAIEMEPPVDADPSKLFACCVCNAYQSDNVEALNQHLQQDRTKQREHEILMMVSGNYVCKLCSYKTNLKDNFQLHCKTDQHLQRLQLVNHTKEGGLRNEWRLKYLNVSNPVHVKCCACDYYTNSTHKLQLHVASPRHEARDRLFRHLQFAEISGNKYYHCSVCSFSTRTKVNLIQHVRTMKHLRNESLHQIQRLSARGEPRIAGNTSSSDLYIGRDAAEDFNDLYTVREYNEADGIQFDVDIEPEEEDMMETTDDQVDDDQETNEQVNVTSSMLKQPLLEAGKSTPEQNAEMHVCPYCNYCNNSEMRIQAHILSQHTQRPQEILCPLCQEDFKDKSKLEKHLTQVHNVTPEGLQRLLLSVGQSQWLMMAPPLTTQSPVGANSEDSTDSKGDLSEGEKERKKEDKMSDGGTDDDYLCQMCTKSFKNIDDLCLHQNEMGHLELKQTPRGPGYLCWKKGCNQYFKTAQSLQVHFREIHGKKQLPASERHVYKYRCNQCSLAFKTMEKLQLHSQYHVIRAATKCVLCERSFRSVDALQKHVESYHTDLSEAELEQYRNSLINNPLLLAGLGGSAIDGTNVADLLKKENSKSDDAMELDEDAIETESNQMEDSDLSTLAKGEVNENGEGFLADDMFKEQQFFEDYLNSQAIAEDSYSDPTCKYKCHRCKVAFIRQSYLRSHNKTLLHRKEKYLDPNRPYKCDVCKKSFTQKNILLVHYNSVSHLHKRTIQEQQQLLQQQQQQEQQQLQQNSLLANSGNGDSDKKPYKCNICKVACSQGSTLDIHMRSVLHQTRASKLQELTLTGQVDLTQPLVEQPEPQKVQDQHKRILVAMLNSKPVSQGQPSVAGAGNIGQLQTHVPSVQLPGQQQPSAAQGSPQLSSTSSSSQSQPQTSTPSCLNQQQLSMAHFTMPRNKSSAVYKSLLESYGFELVMQFNEYHQRRPRKEETEKKCVDPLVKTEGESLANGDVLPNAEQSKKALSTKEKKRSEDLPELGKSACPVCGKKFSSIWVLKAHREEIHKSIVPLSVVVKFSEEFKTDYDKRNSNTQATTPESTPASKPSSSPAETVPPPLQIPVSSQSVPVSMAATQIQFSNAQMQFNPTMMGMGLGLGFPLGTNMPALAAMNLHPPLDLLATAAAAAPPLLPPALDQNFLVSQQKLLQQQQAHQQKQVRTRINDEQLNILRAHFDINNSPTEEQIMEMAEKSGLPQKVIKHWFRNTLFKERQRNKDSPYNFNNPPSTALNLEDYEKTGEVNNMTTNKSKKPSDNQQSGKMEFSSRERSPPKLVKEERHDRDRSASATPCTSEAPSLTSSITSTSAVFGLSNATPSFLTALQGSSNGTSIMSSLANAMTSESPLQTCNPTFPSIVTPPTTPSISLPNSVLTTPTPSSMAHLNALNSCNLGNGSSSSSFSKHDGSTGKRTNRTRFTDYQIKVLQEFFENNAYPKDDDLEYLSKLLNVSPRVIVVWFQNARQKARKVYENQPPLDPDEEGSGRFQRTPGLNYQCKKCLLVFQRYYELIKHQKSHCFKDDDTQGNASSITPEDNNSRSSIADSNQGTDT